MSRISPELIATLFDRHAAALELFAAQWISTPADVVQEAFLQLVRQGRVPDRPAAWLYRVVRNGAISAARRDARRSRNEQAAIGQARLRFEADGESPLDAELAARALEALADEKREVVIARVWGGLTFEEIGEFAAISSSEAHRRYEAALASLRKKLGVTWLTKTATTRDVDEERDLERALSLLRPAASRIDRDRFLFLAGRASAEPVRPGSVLGRWMWPSTTVLSSVAAVVLAVLLVTRPDSAARRADSVDTDRMRVPAVTEATVATGQIAEAQFSSGQTSVPGQVGSEMHGLIDRFERSGADRGRSGSRVGGRFQLSAVTLVRARLRN